MGKQKLLQGKPPVQILKRALGSFLLTIALFGYQGATTLVRADKQADASVLSVQQTKSIQGVVVDTDNVPVIGANVLVKGTTNGNITDVDGKFTLQNVPENATLVVSFIGYLDQEVQVAGKTSFSIVLKEDLQTLEEVVVVGYGVQKKANLTGAVSTVKYDQELENRPITNASQAFTGKMTGVWASQNSGKPGGDGATIRVRGYGTLNNSDPLVLIDGIEGRFDEINPNDIASITVLKDAASAAIYGSRAANGVILVETKKGDGDKISINYNGYVGMQQLGPRYDIISNSAEYMTLWNRAFTNSGSDPLFPQEVIDGFKNGTDPYRYPNTNYFDEIFRTAMTTQHNLSASFGSKKSSNYISMSYLKHDGIVKNTDAERYSLSINTETKATDWLRLGARARLLHKTNSEPYDDTADSKGAYNGIERIVYMMANGHPFSTPYLQDGKTYGGSQALYLSGDKAGQPIVDTRNPFPDLNNGKMETNNNYMKGNVYAIMDLVEGLTLTTQFNAHYVNDHLDRYNQTAFCYTDLNGSNRSKPLDYPSTLRRHRRIVDIFYNTFFANLNYDRTFNEIHEISALFGYQQEGLVKKITGAERTDPAKEDLLQITSGTRNPLALGNMYQYRMMSYFGRISYALMGKYLVEVNFRADGSSRFAKGNRWGYFPSFSAGWRLGEEAFMKKLGVFDNLKLRASWGQLGNQNIGDKTNSDYFPYLTIIDQDYENSYNFNNTLAPGAGITTLVDPQITWETTTTTDLGIDIGVLGNRLNIEADYFNRKTTDIIVRLPIPLIMGGVEAPFQNVGAMTNQGVELNLYWQDKVKSADLSYTVGANLTYLDNEVTKFRGKDSPDQLYLIREGYAYKTLYGFIQEGVYQSNEEAKQHMHSNGYAPVAGDLKYRDINGDGQLDYRDKGDMGNTIPKFTYGINGSVSWKNFDLNMQFAGISNVYGYVQNAWTEPLGISGGTITTRWRDAWTAENPSSTLPHIKVNDTWNRQESSFWTQNTSWFKLKNIQLGYGLPKNLISKLHLQKLYVYVNANNVFVWTRKGYEGFDPEQDSFEKGFNHYPLPKVYTMGLNVTF